MGGQTKTVRLDVRDGCQGAPDGGVTRRGGHALGSSRRHAGPGDADAHRRLRGTLLTLAGGTLWGLNGTLSKLLMGSYDVDPLWMVCVRELTACWLFLAMAGLGTPGRLRGLLRDRRSLWGVVGVAFGSILLSQVAYLEAIDWTNSATATVLQNLSVVIVMLVVCARSRRAPRRRELAGVALAFGGTYLVATGGNPAALSLPPEGLGWGLACAVAATILAIQPLALIRRWGSFAVNGVAFLVSGLALSLAYRPWEHMPALDGTGWLMVAVSVVLGTFGAYALYLQGVKEVGSIRGSMLGTSEPVVATLSSVLWLGVVFGPAELAGFAVIIAMVFLTA